MPPPMSFEFGIKLISGSGQNVLDSLISDSVLVYHDYVDKYGVRFTEARKFLGEEDFFEKVNVKCRRKTGNRQTSVKAYIEKWGDEKTIVVPFGDPGLYQLDGRWAGTTSAESSIFLYPYREVYTLTFDGSGIFGEAGLHTIEYTILIKGILSIVAESLKVDGKEVSTQLVSSSLYDRQKDAIEIVVAP